MTMRERIARAICSKDGGGFCLNIGGDLGCKCGRGEAPHWSKCVATEDQLILSGNADAADAVLDAMLLPTEVMKAAGLKEACDFHAAEDVWQAMIDAAKEGA